MHGGTAPLPCGGSLSLTPLPAPARRLPRPRPLGDVTRAAPRHARGAAGCLSGSGPPEPFSAPLRAPPGGGPSGGRLSHDSVVSVSLSHVWRV